MDEERFEKFSRWQQSSGMPTSSEGAARAARRKTRASQRAAKRVAKKVTGLHNRRLRKFHD
jgi:hypothetical protein